MDKTSHIAMSAHSMDKAQKFFKEVFGWEIKRAPKIDMEYFLVKADPIKQNKEEENHYMPSSEDPVSMVIKVNNIDHYLDKVEDAGGKILVSKQFVGHIGLYARIADREGNAIALWQDI